MQCARRDRCTHQTWPMSEVWNPLVQVSNISSRRSVRDPTIPYPLEGWSPVGIVYLILWTLSSNVWLCRPNSSKAAPSSPGRRRHRYRWCLQHRGWSSLIYHSWWWLSIKVKCTSRGKMIVIREVWPMLVLSEPPSGRHCTSLKVHVCMFPLPSVGL